jgi:hypothetical protein
VQIYLQKQGRSSQRLKHHQINSRSDQNTWLGISDHPIQSPFTCDLETQTNAREVLSQKEASMYPIDSQINQDRIDHLRHEAEVAHELKHLSWQHRLAMNLLEIAQRLEPELKSTDLRSTSSKIVKS